MKRKLTFSKYYLKAKLCKKSTPESIRSFYNRFGFNGKAVLTGEQINQNIFDMVLNDNSLFVGRFGANELSAIKTYDFEIRKNYDKVNQYLSIGAGFFSATPESVNQFTRLMINSIPEADVMGIWMLPFEQYYLNKYGSDRLETAYLLDIEPWSAPSNPWSAALKDKKVLVIHPFSETIESQYKKRELIFPGTDILPEFELKTLKAVQTIAGEKDDRFETWFDALEWMYQEALKIDFDVAIIGCGAYGFPLAAKLKQAGKKAIHLGGATQILFGIRGKRWDEQSGFEYIRGFYNDAWVYPSETDKPKQAKKVEGGCYW